MRNLILLGVALTVAGCVAMGEDAKDLSCVGDACVQPPPKCDGGDDMSGPDTCVEPADGGRDSPPGDCVPDPDPCASSPDRECAPASDGCGHEVSCEASCGNKATTKLVCDQTAFKCVCQPAIQHEKAVDACPGLVPMFCGGAEDNDTPPGCTKTGVSLGLNWDVWCCAAQ